MAVKGWERERDLEREREFAQALLSVVDGGDADPTFPNITQQHSSSPGPCFIRARDVPATTVARSTEEGGTAAAAEAEGTTITSTLPIIPLLISLRQAGSTAQARFTKTTIESP